MPPLRWLALIVLAAVFFSVNPATSQAPAAVNVRVVKYDALAEEVAKHRGKVVLVDFWATTCPPCMASFPKVVALHKAYQGDGLVVISVSIDVLRDEGKSLEPQAKARVEKFLNKMGADFSNVILDESPDLRRDRLGIVTIPCYFVFDRDGKWTRFRGEDEAPGAPFERAEAMVHQYFKK